MGDMLGGLSQGTRPPRLAELCQHADLPLPELLRSSQVAVEQASTYAGGPNQARHRKEAVPKTESHAFVASRCPRPTGHRTRCEALAGRPPPMASGARAAVDCPVADEATTSMLWSVGLVSPAMRTG